jgi:hypothetical protein
MHNGDKSPRLVITSGTGTAWVIKNIYYGPLTDTQVESVLDLEDKYILVIVARDASMVEAPLSPT